MILNILMHKNVKIDCFTQPIFTDIEPEKAAIQEARSLRVCDDIKQIMPYKNLKLFFVGTFNDETGEIFSHDVNGDQILKELCDCRAIVKERLRELNPEAVRKEEEMEEANHEL